MGRGKSGSGVDVHGPSLRIRFNYNGKRCIEILPLKPTAPNIRAAERIAADVRQQIRFGTFDYAASFPNSKNVPKQEALPVQTVRTYAEKWKKTLTGEKSTLDGYRTSMDNFWLTVTVTEDERE